MMVSVRAQAHNKERESISYTSIHTVYMHNKVVNHIYAAGVPIMAKTCCFKLHIFKRFSSHFQD